MHVEGWGSKGHFHHLCLRTHQTSAEVNTRVRSRPHCEVSKLFLRAQGDCFRRLRAAGTPPPPQWCPESPTKRPPPLLLVVPRYGAGICLPNPRHGAGNFLGHWVSHPEGAHGLLEPQGQSEAPLGKECQDHLSTLHDTRAENGVQGHDGDGSGP